MEIAVFLHHILFDHVRPAWFWRDFYNYLANGLIFKTKGN